MWCNCGVVLATCAFRETMRKRTLETNKNLCGTREWTCQTAHRIGSPSLSNCGVFRLLPPELLMVICCFFHMISQYTQHVLFAKQLLQESDSILKPKMRLPCDWPYLPCISVCIGCGYMVVLSHNITRMSTSIHVACGTSRALVGSNLLGCGHMKCFVSNCNGKIEIKVSYLELYSSTASSLLCSCRYVLFSSQIKFPFCLAPKFTLPEISTPEKNRWLEDD